MSKNLKICILCPFTCRYATAVEDIFLKLSYRYNAEKWNHVCNSLDECILSLFPILVIFISLSWPRLITYFSVAIPPSYFPLTVLTSSFLFEPPSMSGHLGVIRRTMMCWQKKASYLDWEEKTEGRRLRGQNMILLKYATHGRQRES